MKGSDRLLGLLVILILFAITPMISAVPPFESTTSSALQFAYPPYETVKENTDFNLHIHVINDTAIQTNTTTSCLVHLYNSTGYHIVEGNMGWDSNNVEFKYLIKGANFTIGKHAYILYCNNTNKQNHLVSGLFEVTTSGEYLSFPQTIAYSFFLVICLFMIYSSSILVVKNPLGKDIPQGEKAYNLKKQNEFIYYLNIMKSKFWIVGLFGIYIFLLLFFVLSNELAFDSNLVSLNEIFSNTTYILAWGLVPFTIFWLAYMIIVFYKSTTDMLKYQFGRIGRGNE